ncbi:hypothetical protein [Chryseolinea lacunae]|uniref:Uncharacterized protein n=1 Tax=Chryseolinea lacunae TaxID=2801331 RepID=A0ABS1KTB9_9BACT|nr:hypothetical protein [Chryseolinea lacunae]MBL0742711.1 hypothetical protein [Chryseolinea lacunae]
MKAVLSVLILYFLLLLTTASFAQKKPLAKKAHTSSRLARALSHDTMVGHTPGIFKQP